MIESGLSLENATKQCLFEYRTISHALTNQTPAKLILGRELRTRFSLLRPRETEELLCDNQNQIDYDVMWKRHSNQMIECSAKVFSETKTASDNSVNIEQTVLRRSERLKDVLLPVDVLILLYHR